MVYSHALVSLLQDGKTPNDLLEMTDLVCSEGIESNSAVWVDSGGIINNEVQSPIPDSGTTTPSSGSEDTTSRGSDLAEKTHQARRENRSEGEEGGQVPPEQAWMFSLMARMPILLAEEHCSGAGEKSENEEEDEDEDVWSGSSSSLSEGDLINCHCLSTPREQEKTSGAGCGPQTDGWEIIHDNSGMEETPCCLYTVGGVQYDWSTAEPASCPDSGPAWAASYISPERTTATAQTTGTSDAGTASSASSAVSREELEESVEGADKERLDSGTCRREGSNLREAIAEALLALRTLR